MAKIVLRNVLTSLHETQDNVSEENQSGRSYRFAAYRQFFWFVIERIGKRNCRVIPSCFIWMIREKFPQEDEIYIYLIYTIRMGKGLTQKQ